MVPSTSNGGGMVGLLQERKRPEKKACNNKYLSDGEINQEPKSKPENTHKGTKTSKSIEKNAKTYQKQKKAVTKKHTSTKNNLK